MHQRIGEGRSAQYIGVLDFIGALVTDYIIKYYQLSLEHECILAISSNNPKDVVVQCTAHCAS